MEVIIAIGLQVGGADARISHDGRSTTRLIGGGAVAVARIILRMIGPKLVADLMSDIIHIERITDGARAPRYAASFPAGYTGDAKVSHPATACAENMTNIVIGIANDVINSGLVLT